MAGVLAEAYGHQRNYYKDLFLNVAITAHFIRAASVIYSFRLQDTAFNPLRRSNLMRMQMPILQYGKQTRRMYWVAVILNRQNFLSLQIVFKGYRG